MDEAIRILICDDHAVVREGLRALIGSEPGLEVVAEAADGVEAVLRARSAHPDVILLDLEMPRMNGLEAIKELRREDPKARILVLTTFDSDDRVFPAIREGALGYLLKDSSPEELVRAIREVAHGEASLDPVVAKKVIRELSRPAETDETAEALTEREVEILRHVAEGLSNQDIAERLVVSEHTVRTHVSNILAKLHLANRTQAALYALREGLAEIRKDD